MKSVYFTIIFVLGILFVLPTLTFAQQKPSIDRAAPSRYLVGQEEQMLLPVNIIGLVQRPGQYLVPFRTDLISLIAFAGGFSEDAKITDVIIIRSSVHDKTESESDKINKQNAKVFKVNIKKYIEKGDINQIPQLKPDDTIVVKGTATRTINKVFVFLQNVVIITQIAFYIAVIK